jgi:hypothetical protein
MWHAWEEEKCLQGFSGKARRKETSSKTRCRWEDNIKMDLKEIGMCVMDWIRLAQDRNQWQATVKWQLNLCVHNILVDS